MHRLEMTTEESNMMLVALQHAANGCEKTAEVLEANCLRGANWRAAESREMAQKYDYMAVNFREQIKQGGK